MQADVSKDLNKTDSRPEIACNPYLTIRVHPGLDEAIDTLDNPPASEHNPAGLHVPGSPIMFATDENAEPCLDQSSRRHSSIETFQTKGYHVGFRHIVPTLLALLFTAGLGLALIIYLLARKIPDQTLRQAFFVNHTLLVDEGFKVSSYGNQEVKLNGLLITSLTAHIISWSQPLIMGLIAFRLAAKWLKEQEGQRDTAGLPTAEQYGLIFQLCSSGSVLSIFTAGKYLAKRRKPTTPRLLIEAVAVVSTVSAFTIAIGLVDTWLHAASSAAFYTSIEYASDLSNQSIAFGTTFNTTLCSDSESFMGSTTCGQGVPGTGGTDGQGSNALLATGAQVEGNRSSVHTVTTLNDQKWMAIITRSNTPQNITYTANTFGITAACRSVAPTFPVGSNLGMPEIKDCGQQSINEGIVLSVDDSPVEAWGEPIPANDTNLYVANLTLFYPNGMSVNKNGVSTGTSPGANPAIIPCFQPTTGYALVAACTMSVYDIVIESTVDNSGTRKNVLVKRVDSDWTTTARLWAGLYLQTVMTSLISNTQPVVIPATTVDEAMAAISQEIARLTLAFAGGILIPSPPQAAGTVMTKPVSSYPIAPVLIFLVLLFVYALLVVVLFAFVFVTAPPSVRIGDGSRNFREVSLMRLLQKRLTDPSSVIADSFRGSEVARVQNDMIKSLETDKDKLFDERGTSARLKAEILIDPVGDPYFSIQAVTATRLTRSLPTNTPDILLGNPSEGTVSAETLVNEISPDSKTEVGFIRT